MNIRDGYNSKKMVMFDTWDRLDDKIEKLTSMLNKITTQSSYLNRQFKPEIYQRQKERTNKKLLQAKEISK